MDHFEFQAYRSIKTLILKWRAFWLSKWVLDLWLTFKRVFFENNSLWILQSPKQKISENFSCLENFQLDQNFFSLRSFFYVSEIRNLFLCVRNSFRAYSRLITWIVISSCSITSIRFFCIIVIYRCQLKWSHWSRRKNRSNVRNPRW